MSTRQTTSAADQRKAPYGIRKAFKTSAGVIFADTRAEAIAQAEKATTTRPVEVQGPSVTPSLRELGIRAQVRHMNRAGL